MQVRITDPGEYDRHEGEVRFLAIVDGKPTSVTITDQALFLVREALGMEPASSLTTYAASGSFLKTVVADVVKRIGDHQPTYLITNADILRVTGVEDGMAHVPKRWKPR